MRLLGACCCLLALGLATQAAGSSAGNAIEKTELSGNLKNDVASMLRNVRDADPKKKNAGNDGDSGNEKKLKKDKKKKKSVQKKGKGKGKKKAQKKRKSKEQ